MLFYYVADLHDRFNVAIREINTDNIMIEANKIGVLIIES